MPSRTANRRLQEVNPQCLIEQKELVEAKKVIEHDIKVKSEQAQTISKKGKEKSKGVGNKKPHQYAQEKAWGKTHVGFAKKNTKIEILAGDKPLLQINRRQGATKLETASDLILPDDFADRGLEYVISILNKRTNLAVVVIVDGERVSMPNYARRPDGSKIFAKKSRVPVFKNRERQIAGYEVTKERTDERYAVTERPFKFEKVDYKYREADFPELAAVEAAEEEDDDACARGEAAYVDGGDDYVGEEAPQKMFGGVIEVQLFQLKEILVSGRSTAGGEYTETREPRVAEIGRGDARTVPVNETNERAGAVISRNSDKKHERGFFICSHKIYYSTKAKCGK